MNHSDNDIKKPLAIYLNNKRFNYLSSCPTRARTWTLLYQKQTCCQLHHGTISLNEGANIKLLFKNQTMDAKKYVKYTGHL